MPPEAQSVTESAGGERTFGPGELVEAVFSTFGVEELAGRLSAFFRELPASKRTPAQELVRRHGAFTTAANITAQLGDLGAWRRDLLELAKLLELVETRTIEDLGAELEAGHAAMSSRVGAKTKEDG